MNGQRWWPSRFRFLIVISAVNVVVAVLTGNWVAAIGFSSAACGWYFAALSQDIADGFVALLDKARAS